MKHFKNRIYLIPLLALSILLVAITVVGCAAKPEPIPKKIGGIEREIKLQPEWTIKTPNNNSTHESTLEIYLVGDEFYPSFFWVREKLNYKLDDIERLSALTFLRQKGVDIDNAEIKNEKKIMFVYPSKEDAADYEKDKDDVNIIIGLDD